METFVSNCRLGAFVWTLAFGNQPHNCAYLYSRETLKHDSDFHTRMFGNDNGISEDAATGSAAVAFAGAIQKFDKPGNGTSRFVIEQGFEMHRPSILQLEMDVEGGEMTGQRLGGQAVVVGSGELYL